MTDPVADLLRLMDLEEGRVLVDGVDIAEVGLRQLRSHIAVIPQDPVLFTGTIRLVRLGRTRTWHRVLIGGGRCHAVSCIYDGNFLELRAFLCVLQDECIDRWGL